MHDERPPKERNETTEGLKNNWLSKQRYYCNWEPEHSEERYLTIPNPEVCSLQGSSTPRAFSQYITEALLLDTTYHDTALCSFHKACQLNGLSLSQQLTDQLSITLFYHFESESWISTFVWKLSSQVTEVLQKAKIIQSYFHFSLNQLTRRVGTLHSYMTSASSLLISK